MNQKILAIGSIIACTILLVASLSPVVGYNTARSSVKDSPLFNIRTKRAINEESDGLTCEYVGKGKDMAFLPIRNNKIAMIREVTERLLTMDDDEFNRFMHVVVNRLAQENSLKDVDAKKVIIALHQVRVDPELLKNYIVHGQNDFTVWDVPCTVDGKWRPGCYLEEGFWLVFLLLFKIYLFYLCLRTATYHFDTVC